MQHGERRSHLLEAARDDDGVVARNKVLVQDVRGGFHLDERVELGQPRRHGHGARLAHVALLQKEVGAKVWQLRVGFRGGEVRELEGRKRAPGQGGRRGDEAASEQVVV